jgi:predicted nucleotidyltransferase
MPVIDHPHQTKMEAIQHKLHEKLPDLRQRYGIKSLGIFGSYLHGTQTKKSDLDILVEFYEDAPVTLIGFVTLEREIAAHLGLRVDLVEQGTLKPNIGKRILAEVVPV